MGWDVGHLWELRGGAALRVTATWMRARVRGARVRAGHPRARDGSRLRPARHGLGDRPARLVRERARVGQVHARGRGSRGGPARRDGVPDPRGRPLRRRDRAVRPRGARARSRAARADRRARLADRRVRRGRGREPRRSARARRARPPCSPPRSTRSSRSTTRAAWSSSTAPPSGCSVTTAEDAVGAELAELVVPPGLRQRHRDAIQRFARDARGHAAGQAGRADGDARGRQRVPRGAGDQPGRRRRAAACSRARCATSPTAARPTRSARSCAGSRARRHPGARPAAGDPQRRRRRRHRAGARRPAAVRQRRGARAARLRVDRGAASRRPALDRGPLRDPRRGRRADRRSRSCPGRRALAGEEEAVDVVRFRLRATGEERWSAVKATPIRDEDGFVTMAINVIEDITTHKRAERAQRFLADSAAVLAETLDPVARARPGRRPRGPRVADWVAVHMPGDAGIELVAIAHRDPESVMRAQELDRQMPTRHDAPRGVANVLRTGQSELYPDVPRLQPSTDDERARAEHVRAFGMRSALIVPMNARGGTIGDAHARHRPVRPPLRRAGPGARRGARAALRDGGRQRAPVLGARLHRAHAPAEPAPVRAARHPRDRGGRPLPADRRGQRGRRRLLRPVRVGRARLDGRDGRRLRQGPRRRRGDGAGALHAARRGDARAPAEPQPRRCSTRPCCASATTAASARSPTPTWSRSPRARGSASPAEGTRCRCCCAPTGPSRRSESPARCSECCPTRASRTARCRSAPGDALDLLHRRRDRGPRRERGRSTRRGSRTWSRACAGAGADAIAARIEDAAVAAQNGSRATTSRCSCSESRPDGYPVRVQDGTRLTAIFRCWVTHTVRVQSGSSWTSYADRENAHRYR